MDSNFPFSEFIARFPDDDACLDEIKRMRYPRGILCVRCRIKAEHYKIRGRTAYSCQYCRNHIYPLADTVFEKTTTPLRAWFYCLFLMTQTRADLSIKQLQRELGVTYKTAWRMYTRIRVLMEKNNGDLLSVSDDSTVHKWVFFNKIEFTVAQKKEASL